MICICTQTQCACSGPVGLGIPNVATRQQICCRVGSPATQTVDGHVHEQQELHVPHLRLPRACVTQRTIESVCVHGTCRKHNQHLCWLSFVHGLIQIRITLDDGTLSRRSMMQPTFRKRAHQIRTRRPDRHQNHQSGPTKSAPGGPTTTKIIKTGMQNPAGWCKLGWSLGEDWGRIGEDWKDIGERLRTIGKILRKIGCRRVQHVQNWLTESIPAGLTGTKIIKTCLPLSGRPDGTKISKAGLPNLPREDRRAPKSPKRAYQIRPGKTGGHQNHQSGRAESAPRGPTGTKISKTCVLNPPREDRRAPKS